MSRRQMDESARKLRRIGSIRDRFVDADGMKLFPSNLMLSGSEFDTVGVATK